MSTISEFIPTQFPATYRENSPMFVAFMKAYYEWMESPNNPLYISRKIYEIQDIDTTLDEFITYFKQKYLRDIQFDTKADIRNIIKHALDIYRSKGTPREIELLFQLVYQTPIDIYYPSLDLFRLSDGNWLQPTYLELALADHNAHFEQHEIIGMRSGARAFVDKVIRTNVKNKLIDVAFISAVTKDFEVYENITSDDGLISTVIGSLSTIDIQDGTGAFYEVGDTFDILSATGMGAKGRATKVVDKFGEVKFTLLEGGYGYANGASIYISDQVIEVNNATFSNTKHFYEFGEVVTQPMARIDYISNTVAILQGNQVTSYYGNGDIMGTGKVLSIRDIVGSNATIVCSLESGSLNNTLHTTANAGTANIWNYTDITITGQYVNRDPDVVVYLSNASAAFTNNEIIQNGVYGNRASVVRSTLARTTLNGVVGTLIPGQTLTGLTSNVTATVEAVRLVIGISNTTNTFISTDFNFVKSENMATSTCSRAFTGSGALVTFNANNITYPEVISIAPYLINDISPSSNTPYNEQTIGVTEYGFPGLPEANLTYGEIGEALFPVSKIVGKISALLTPNHGDNYDHPPIVRIIERDVRSFRLKDYELDLVGSGNFTVGECVHQEASGARGLVKSLSNTSVLLLQNLKFANAFVPTTNTGTMIMGNTSLATANIVTVRYDDLSPFMGDNCIVDGTFGYGNGIMTELDIIDSGYGYLDGQNVEFVANSQTASGGSGTVVLNKQGRHQGYYETKGGFLSDQKRLFDGEFWQNFSYQIISPIVYEKYQKMMKQIGHPAGTRMFGKFKHTTASADDKQISLGSITIT